MAPASDIILFLWSMMTKLLFVDILNNIIKISYSMS